MLKTDDPVVQFKTSLLDRILPTRNVLVCGDMYIVEGGYTEYCATHGAEVATLVDTLETVAWQQSRLQHRNLEFFKGNFADQGLMESLPTSYSAAVAFDVLLHQPALMHTLHLMVSKVEDGGSVTVVQPTLEELSTPNGLVFLPGNPDTALYPMDAPDQEYAAFSTETVNQTQWIWGITASFMKSALLTEGFEVVHEEWSDPLPNPRWTLWGCVAERRRTPDTRHWSAMRAHPLIHDGW